MAEKPDVEPIPDDYQTITPYLTVSDAEAALRFYADVFGAEELFRMDGPSGKIAHAEMKVGDSHFMLADEFDEWGNRSPRTIGGTGTSLMMYVEDVDGVFARAVEAGAAEISPPEDHFYGDRSGTVEDPFGHRWMLSTHVEDVSPEELERRGREMMAQM